MNNSPRLADWLTPYPPVNEIQSAVNQPWHFLKDRLALAHDEAFLFIVPGGVRTTTAILTHLWDWKE